MTGTVLHARWDFELFQRGFLKGRRLSGLVAVGVLSLLESEWGEEER